MFTQLTSVSVPPYTSFFSVFFLPFFFGYVTPLVEDPKKRKDEYRNSQMDFLVSVVETSRRRPGSSRRSKRGSQSRVDETEREGGDV